MTSLKHALRAAGIEPADERLRRIAREVLQAHPNDWRPQCDALFAAVSPHADLLWAMFRLWAPEGARFALQRAADELLRDRAGGGQLSGEGQQSCAPAARQGGPGHDHSGSHRAAARSARPSASEVTAAREEIRRLSALDWMQVNGKPIGDCTPNEVREWLAARQAQNRFAELLIGGVPTDQPIRRFVRPDEADALYRRAREETNAE